MHAYYAMPSPSMELAAVGAKAVAKLVAIRAGWLDISNNTSNKNHEEL